MFLERALASERKEYEFNGEEISSGDSNCHY
jgi:hypothetical protein